MTGRRQNTPFAVNMPHYLVWNSFLTSGRTYHATFFICGRNKIVNKEEYVNFWTGCSVPVQYNVSCDFYMPYLDYIMILCLKQATNEQKLKTIMHLHHLLKDKSPVPLSLINMSPKHKKHMLERCSQQDKAYLPYQPDINWQIK